jgi:hypothetical protein
MSTAMSLRYPASRYETVAWTDLTDPDERARLTGPAVRGMVGLAKAWSLTVEQTCALLGDVSPSTWHAWVKSPPKDLGTDRLTRVSYLMGMYSALQVLYPGPLADAWMSRPNTNALFGGQPPITVVLAGGIPAMSQVRALLDARRGGA